MKSTEEYLEKNNHVRHIHLKGNKNNNKMEWINSIIRDRENVFRGLKKIDTTSLTVYMSITISQKTSSPE